MKRTDEPKEGWFLVTLVILAVMGLVALAVISLHRGQ